LSKLKMLMVGALTLCLAWGCDDEETPPTPDAMPMTDASAGDAMSTPDAEPEGLLCGWSDDDFDWGVMIGRNMRPLTLSRCDGTEFSLPHAGMCNPTDVVDTENVRFSVLIMSAGWCAPCRRESEMLSEFLTDVYKAHGVEVIQVLTATEGPDLDQAYCDAWVSTYDLDRPNFAMLMDPGNTQTGRYFPAGSLPANLIVDNSGIIQFREYGAETRLTSVTNRLDELLCENYTERCGG